MYLAFDPGKTTGWASFDSKGDITGFGQVSLDELMSLSDVWAGETIEKIICEDFKLFRSKAKQQAGSRMEASQAIGIIKNLARLANTEIVMQDPTIKGIAVKLTEVKPSGSHDESHWVDAFNHGAYWLIGQGIRKTALQMRQAGEL